MLCNVFKSDLRSTYHEAAPTTIPFNCMGNRLLGLEMFLRSSFPDLIVQKWVNLQRFH